LHCQWKMQVDRPTSWTLAFISRAVNGASIAAYHRPACGPIDFIFQTEIVATFFPPFSIRLPTVPLTMAPQFQEEKKEKFWQIDRVSVVICMHSHWIGENVGEMHRREYCNAAAFQAEKSNECRQLPSFCW